MKIRNGFVSNSSSSSYLIAFRNDQNKCPHCGRSDPDLFDMIERYHMINHDNEVDLEDAEAVLRDLDTWDWAKPEEIEKLKAQVKEYAEKDGWHVAQISISYHCDELQQVLNNMLEVM